MKTNDLENKNTIVVYGGRFQPFHRGHLAAYQWLRERFPKVFIATSGKTELDKSPFSFDEKRQQMIYTGLPSDNIIQTSNPYQPHELLEFYDGDNTVLIIAVSEKDMIDNPRFSFEPKKDGTPTYYQPFEKNINNLKPLSKHGYVLIVPTFTFPILGNRLSSSTEIRDLFRNSNISDQKKIIKDLYGTYDETIHKQFKEKLNILNSSKFTFQEAIDHHFKFNIPLRESILRPGSISFFEMINHIKENINNYVLDEIDLEILSTDIGEIHTLVDGTPVPLDLPFFEDEITEAEYRGKNVELNKPKRGGPKKFYVYVRDPKTKNVKKVSFGDKGLSVKSNDPARVKSFVARHDCKNKTDKTKAGYWACRAPRYKSLGIKGGQWW
jgi:cytidyltransferase-like protein